MKKKLTLLLVLALSLCLVLAFSSCGENTDTDTNTGTQTETPNGSETDTSTDTSADTETETDSNSETESDTEIGSDTDTESVTDTETDTDTDTTADSSTNTDTDTDADSNTDTDINSDTDTDTDTNEPEHIHVEAIIPAVEPTCAKTGLTEGKKCSKCGEILIEQEIVDAKGHKYEGSFTCTVCGDTLATSKGLEYTLDEETNTYTVTDIGTCTDRDIVIPYTYNDLPVTSIGNSAFYDCYRLTSIKIPNSVTSIGYSAFEYCTSLKSITIPDSVTSIGDWAFYDCDSLTSIKIPNSVTSIGEDAFWGCSSLTSLNYLGNIEDWCNISFGDSSANPLYYAKNLYLNGELITNLVIPDTVTEIKDYAFYNCTSLTSITIPDSVTSIGEDAFEDCYKLVEVYNLSSLNITAGSSSNGYVGYYTKIVHTSLDEESILKTTDDGYVFAVVSDSKIYLVDYIGNETELTLPESYNGNNYEEIYRYAFYNRDDITKITIPDSVTSIGWDAFSNCTSLVEINFNATAMNDLGFDNYVFYNAGKNGEGIKVTIGKNVTKIPAYLFCPKSSSSSYPPKITSVIFEEGSVCESIGNYAFRYCDSLTSITIPDSVTSIGNSAFSSCDSLTSVTIPDSVTSIGNSAFSSCDSLTSVTIPDSVTSIGDWAFWGCSSLTSVTIGNSVTSIGEYAFYNCYSLTSIIVDENNTSYKSIDGNLYTKDGTALIQYAIGKTDTSFIIPDSVTSIGNSAFSGCTSLASVTIPDSVTSIGSSAFENCTSLTSVIIGDSVATIGNYAFYYCYKLTSIKIPNSVTSIGDYAFSRCTSLTIYCEATSQPSGWSSSWNHSNRPVYWYREDEPTTDGRYWHYVDGVVTVWE